jgi:hypothetical protein
LSIVATLAARWGVEQHGSVTTVWAIVPLTTGEARAFETRGARVRTLGVRTVDVRDG